MDTSATTRAEGITLGAASSIRGRVFAMGCLLLLCASIAVSLFLRDYAHRAADRAFDRLLAASALTIAGSVQIDDNDVTAEPPFSSLAMLSGNDRVFYSVRNASGRPVTGYDDLAPGLPLARSASPVFSDAVYHDESIRIATVGRLISAGRHAGWVTIRVAETRDSRDALAAEILNRSALPLLVVVPVALALLWFGIQRAFAPLALIERSLRARAPDDLTPLEAPVPREVRGLAEALNGFMRRLSGIMSSLNNLVADAAHQVRTPLASLRAQAEVAMDETDPERLRARVARIHQNATHASQLINQLLMDATITHRLGMRGHESVGIAETVNETRRRIGPLDAQRLRIFIAPEVRRARVVGDRVALREMLRNLVDNALRYAPDGPVEIQATPVAGYRVALTVNDCGPGIADDEKDAVQQRFTRGRDVTGTPGSGLGLAIAKTVAEAHGGALWLQDRAGGGLSARVVLPRARPVYPRLLLAAGMVMASLAALPPQPVRAQAIASDAASSAARSATERIPAARGAAAPSTVTRFPAPQPPGRLLVIAGTTDTPAAAPVIVAFQASQPDVTIEYREMGSRELYEATVAGRLGDADILISSAADLQIRLANDGYAMRYDAPGADRLPPWAVWRDEVFGFAFEPAVIVYNPRRFNEGTVPRSRQELLRLLESDRARLHGRVGTYDISRSSVGQLLAEEDEQVSSNFWGLTNALGQVGARLSVTTAGILDAIENDELDIGYNVLGSYALARQAAGRRIGVVFPQDYVLVLPRSAMIARHAPQPALGRAFIDWLLSAAGQNELANVSGLGPMVDEGGAGRGGDAVLARSSGIVQPVVLGPALLVGLDRQRNARFVQNWTRLVTDTPALGRTPPP
ncbi:HAMP domain-containing histidine kinase [Bordetella genomosp. 8]|uniref:histidine kinase n=1 Tax=Bordetella genomosp. 8 TaxID=1416806 RepID=A0A1W6YRM3_9BORD|nr:extracellular solute-binding protein [Bordetella genomosp. 8]ARP83730.1 HAMP domain-containing histidine kinase [Bordetella genomosp. 8]